MYWLQYHYSTSYGMVKQKKTPRLPADVWKHISLMSRHTYFLLSQVCKHAAVSDDNAMQQFSKTITVDTELDTDITTVLTNNSRAHSVKDLPASTTLSHRSWKRNGFKHRDIKYGSVKQKPAEILMRSINYAKYGVITRKQYPAVIRQQGDLVWRHMNKTCRVNNADRNSIDRNSIDKNSTDRNSTDRNSIDKNSIDKNHTALPSSIVCNGTRFWYNNDMLDRVGAPAVIYNDGNACYYTNDKIQSQNDLPAMVSGKCRTWILNSKIDRDVSSNPISKYIGQKYSDTSNGTVYWYNSGGYRAHYPSIINADGSMACIRNNLTHHDTHPAIISGDGKAVWYNDGSFIKERST